MSKKVREGASSSRPEAESTYVNKGPGHSGKQSARFLYAHEDSSKRYKSESGQPVLINKGLYFVLCWGFSRKCWDTLDVAEPAIHPYRHSL